VSRDLGRVVAEKSRQHLADHAGDAVAVAVELGQVREAESGAREKFREWVGGQDFVGRDEFEAVKAMAAAARDENEALKKRIVALEAKAGGAPKRAPKGKPGARP